MLFYCLLTGNKNKTNRLQDNRGSEVVLCVVILLFIYIMYDYCHTIF